MKKLFLLLLFCHVSSPVKHTLKVLLTWSSGVTNFPEFVGTLMKDENVAMTCDTNREMTELKQDWITKILLVQKIEPKQDWIKKVFKDDPDHFPWYVQRCFEVLPDFKYMIFRLKMALNQSEGVHTLQMMSGCELDDETQDISGFLRYGYDGEDLVSFDLKTLTWITAKQSLDFNGYEFEYFVSFVTKICHNFLKIYVTYSKSSLLRTVLPSVSLFQKTPSSPVTCHATGFYPNRAMIFWRKDGEEIHEDVEHGDILPNHDGTFQMRVGLNLSSVTPEDWRRYDCVFHLSGVKDDIVTRLDKAEIRTNWEKPSHMTIPITVAMVVLALALIAVTGFIIYKKKKASSPPSSFDNNAEFFEELNPET
ncbi:major histocompatibility complex class I-related gene protein [Larimichthys crocea]|uniref:major histocompatibility complex class I-related gene protein n=1 Tax=Larimichthys crocea TaxID=215358 RepID=UPI00090143C1|nr:major histocompatibility complex class I-related gene protein [Larimichthys crocea]